MRNDISQLVRLYIPTEDEVIRDKFKDIIGRGFNYVELHSHPTSINPSQKTLDKLGIVQSCNAIFNITKKEYEDKVGLDPVDIIRYRIGFEIQTNVMRYYEINIANYHGAISLDQFRYLAIGGIETT
jgi:hypothetical protein